MVQDVPRGACQAATDHDGEQCGQLPKLFRQANALLTEQLDALAVQFKGAQPGFHGEYQSARSIVDPATNRSGTEAGGVSVAPAKAA